MTRPRHIKPAACPEHGRQLLVNAGAPNMVRCFKCGSIYEPCWHCGGSGWMPVFGLLPGMPDEEVPCLTCGRMGWLLRKSPFGVAYIAA